MEKEIYTAVTEPEKETGQLIHLDEIEKIKRKINLKINNVLKNQPDLFKLENLEKILCMECLEKLLNEIE